MTSGHSGLAMYGDNTQTSAEELVVRYAPLVKRIAQHLLGRMPSSVQIEDLLQAGMIGLLEASSNYDAGKGASFETYAGIRIRGAMIDEVRRGDWAPRSVHRNSRRISDAIQQVEARLGHDANDQQVASELGVEVDEYHAMLQDSMTTRLFSFDEVTDNDEGGEQVASELQGPDGYVQDSHFRSQLAREIGKLPERERLVLSLYYDEELNLKEIGLVLGVSESRVSQIHSQAALRLRSRLADW